MVVVNERDSASQAEPPVSEPEGQEDENLAEAILEAGETDAEQAANGSGADAQVDPLLQLQLEAEKLQQELTEAKEQVLRAAAEAQNVRKRAERDVENAHKYGQEKLISALLPVLDNLDRALDAAKKTEADGDSSAPEGSAFTPIIEGVELTRKSALDALKQFSVEVLEPYGEPFDPQFHEAMTMIESDTAEPNSVIDVLQKGYRLHGRLLRAAMVVIAKA
ncbi:MAG: nucleotide exchange factor GrpE [Pseudomonadales bacterium]|nr:nucleotide exchange factor GrpE [Pseudomonadales bacterium]